MQSNFALFRKCKETGGSSKSRNVSRCVQLSLFVSSMLRMQEEVSTGTQDCSW